VSQVLAGQACLATALKGDQKIKYDNMKLISIVLSCPRQIQYLEVYSLLIKLLTNLIMILYLLALQFFQPSTDSPASACRREVPTKQFKFHNVTACLYDLISTMFHHISKT